MSDKIDPEVKPAPQLPDIIYKMKLEIYSCYREALGADNLAAAIAGKKPPNNSLHYELVAAQVKELMQAYCQQHGIMTTVLSIGDTVKIANDVKDLKTVINVLATNQR